MINNHGRNFMGNSEDKIDLISHTNIEDNIDLISHT